VSLGSCRRYLHFLTPPVPFFQLRKKLLTNMESFLARGAGMFLLSCKAALLPPSPLFPPGFTDAFLGLSWPAVLLTPCTSCTNSTPLFEFSPFFVPLRKGLRSFFKCVPIFGFKTPIWFRSQSSPISTPGCTITLRTLSLPYPVPRIKRKILLPSLEVSPTPRNGSAYSFFSSTT